MDFVHDTYDPQFLGAYAGSEFGWWQMRDVLFCTRVFTVEIATIGQQLGCWHRPRALGLFAAGPPSYEGRKLLELDRRCLGVIFSAFRLQEDLWTAAADVRAERTFENPYYAKLAEGFGTDGEYWMKSSDVWAHLGILAPAEQAKGRRAVGQALESLSFERKRCTKKGDPIGCQRDEPYYKREAKP